MSNSTRGESVIIVAGGSGKRMGSDIPKQFLIIKGKPILMHTIEVFYRYSSAMQIVVVLPAEQIALWDELRVKYDFTIPHQIAQGGSERFFSVSNGLKLVEEGRFVAVHDGVRPLVSLQTIRNCFNLVAIKKAVVPVIDAVESIRKITDDGSVSVPRHLYKIVQTPQVFDYEVISTSYNLPFSPLFTDDASVVEAAGFAISLADGNSENIKVTSPIDLAIAEIWLGESKL